MQFFDCNVTYGLPSDAAPMMPAPSIDEVRREMARAGVSRALVRREEQICVGAVRGNRLVADDVRGTSNLWGVWAILPSHTHEIPDPLAMPVAMKEARIAAWQFRPDIHKYAFHWRVLHDWFDVAQERRIPIFISLSAGISDLELLNVLERYPELTVIIELNSVWPFDRRIRPFLKEFPHCHVELSNYFGDGTIESLVEEYDSSRILFGSGFYYHHVGGYMLMVKHAEIDAADKARIASGNMAQLIDGILYD